MKPSAFLLFSSLVGTLQAATLKVGSGQTYSTIAAAYNVASPGDTIYIYPGTYKEKLTISKDSITLKGSAYPSTSPSSNLAVITQSTYASTSISDEESATLLVTGNNVKIYNLNITNSAGTSPQAAVALSLSSLSTGVYTCALKSYQDTLLSNSGSHFFARCYIEGAVDFVFGLTANSWYQGCTLGVLKTGGTITAQGRRSGTSDGFFVFDKAKIVLGLDAGKGTKGNFFLGRPWHDYARVVFQNSDEGNIIIAEGWEAWRPTQSTANVLFAEYNNVNADGTRVSWAKKLTSAYSIGTILPTYSSWVDSSFLGVSAP